MWEQIFLPENAPKEWADRSVLWNAVESSEKSKDSRLARELIVALPKELTQETNEFLLQYFCIGERCGRVTSIASLRDVSLTSVSTTEVIRIEVIL